MAPLLFHALTGNSIKLRRIADPIIELEKTKAKLNRELIKKNKGVWIKTEDRLAVPVNSKLQVRPEVHIVGQTGVNSFTPNTF